MTNDIILNVKYFFYSFADGLPCRLFGTFALCAGIDQCLLHQTKANQKLVYRKIPLPSPPNKQTNKQNG